MTARPSRASRCRLAPCGMTTKPPQRAIARASAFAFCPTPQRFSGNSEASGTSTAPKRIVFGITSKPWASNPSRTGQRTCSIRRFSSLANDCKPPEKSVTPSGLSMIQSLDSLRESTSPIRRAYCARSPLMASS